MRIIVVKKWIITLTCILILLISVSVDAEQNKRSVQSSISTPRGLEDRVNFWRLVFTKYGKYHRVFHDRSYPEVIFSVLDFSEFEEKLSGSDLLRAKEQEILKEEGHIRSALTNLANGSKPRSAFEERINRLYRQLPNFSSSMFRDALSPDRIRYQTGIKERFRDGIVRSGKYLKSIEHVFVEEGLPPELGRLPLVESSFDYTAYSSVGAAGIWQFMPATAKRYMIVNSNIDQRRDPIIATRAAAKYLKNSFDNTGHWPLAVTSYNHGLSGILRAAREVGSNNIVDIIRSYKSKSFGFASSNFYAEFLAALDVELNAEKYFPGVVRDSEVEFDEIRLTSSLNFSSLCNYSEASVSEIKELNLGLLDRVVQGRSPIPAGTLVKIPLKSYSKFSKRLPNVALVSRSTNFVSHLYAKDSSIPKENKIDLPMAEVKSVDEDMLNAEGQNEGTEVIVLGEEFANNSKESSAYKPQAIVVKKDSGKLKRVPTKADRKNQRSSAANKKAKPQTYSIKKGDNLSSIAKKFNVSTDSIRKANNIKSGGVIKSGSTIKIPKN